MARPGSEEAAAVAGDDAARRILLDDDSSQRLDVTSALYLTATTPVRVGDTAGLTEAVVLGVGSWRLEPAGATADRLLMSRDTRPASAGRQRRSHCFTVINDFLTFSQPPGRGATSAEDHDVREVSLSQIALRCWSSRRVAPVRCGALPARGPRRLCGDRGSMMIVTAWDHALFDALDAAARWQLIEDYRGAEPRSEIGRYREVDDLLERICQQVHAAMWVPSFDAQAWALLHHDGQPTCQEALEGSALSADAAALARLHALTLQVGWWPVFDYPDPDPFTLGRVITVGQAGALYSAQTGCQTCAGPALASAAPGSVHRDSGAALEPSGGGPLHALVLDVRDPAGHAAGSAGHAGGRP